MNHRILRINISLFVTLFGLMASIDAQADDRFDDRIELAGNVLVFALPIAAAGLTLGFKDGQGAL
jgi:hypothetical protein